MTHLCTSLLREVGSGTPVDVRALASFRGARVEEVDQPYAAGLLDHDGVRLVIRVRASDSEERRRFTVCHEICHTFLPGFRESPRMRADLDVERFDPEDPEEYLCDLGAAELLLPRETISPLLIDGFTIDDILALATRFRASIEATGLRCVGLSREPVALAILERGGEKGELHVRRSASAGLPAIGRGSSIPRKVALARILDEGEMAYRGESGLIPGTFSVSARSMPYDRAGEQVERAIALIRPPPA